MGEEPVTRPHGVAVPAGIDYAFLPADKVV